MMNQLSGHTDGIGPHLDFGAVLSFMKKRGRSGVEEFDKHGCLHRVF